MSSDESLAIAAWSEGHAAAEDLSAHENHMRNAWLAYRKQQLLTPARAIRELSDLLLKDAAERGQEDFAEDLKKIHASAECLLATVDHLLDPGAFVGVDRVSFPQRVRHDLRSALAHIIGISEYWLEDAAELLLEGFVGDLGRIHALCNQVLVSIDAYFDFSESPGGHDSEPGIDVPKPHDTVVESGHVLVVDDNEINRYLLLRRLTEVGHRVSVADNGRTALEMLRAQSFDLVLLDIIMPELNGFEVLERLKTDEVLRHVPVIMISAFDEIGCVIRCIERGAEDYLAKPFNPVLLHARINACLEKKRLRDREVLHLEEIQKERRRADELLQVILPDEVIGELKQTNAVRPRRFEEVAVLFCDIVDFTPYCDRSQPEDVVGHLQRLIETWEEIALRNQVEKIKTIGDAFMAAAGLLRRPTDHPVMHCMRCGLEMIAACQQSPAGWNVRVGVHYGPVVAGVIGKRQYLFDLWGDTVNTAARMESHGVAGAVVLSGAAYQTVSHRCRGVSHGIVAVKGKTPMEMFRLDGLASGE
jgi:class 3 adenylate cyclase